MTEDEMVGWHHRLDGHEFEQAQGNADPPAAWAWGPEAPGVGLPPNIGEQGS